MSTFIPYQSVPGGDDSTVRPVPVFEYYAARAANPECEGPMDASMLATRQVGELSSFADLTRYIDKPNTRLEIERAPGLEELRAIDETDGTYRAAKGRAAQDILSEWDARESQLFADADPLPEGMPNERESIHARSIIDWDEDGNRILPPFRLAGEVSTKAELRSKEPDYSVCWVGNGAAVANDYKTGKFYVLRGKDAEEMESMQEYSCPMPGEGDADAQGDQEADEKHHLDEKGGSDEKSGARGTADQERTNDTATTGAHTDASAGYAKE